LKNWCSLALKITTAKITTAKVGGAVIFRNVYYRIEATEYRQGDPRNLLEGAAGALISVPGSGVKKSVL
jgi:hypothetical protein